MKKIFSTISFLSLSQKIFTCFLSLFFLLNISGFIKEMLAYEKLRSYLPYQFVGNQFLEFRPLLENVSIVSYDSDKNLSTTENDKKITQAQFILSPTVLDAHNKDHRYIIFDCSNITVAAERMKKLHAIPLKINSTGIILAEKP